MRKLATLVLLFAACGGSSHETTPTDGSMTDGGVTPTDGGSGFSCTQGASCAAADKSCAGLVQNEGKSQFGLRMTQLSLSHPAALASGVVAQTIANAVTPSLMSCDLDGAGTFSWLIQFDTTAGTITTGGAKPVADPTMGYSFDMDMISGFSVAPAVMTAQIASGSFSVASGTPLAMPIFLDAAGSSSIVLPIQHARLSMGTLSSSQNCIGSYNASGLSPANSCQPSDTTPAFINGGKVDGFITLADADKVTLSQLGATLCVILSGDPGTYGDGASPVAHCKTDSGGKIVFQGDWCSTTNAAAAGGCADAVQLSGDFAAGSIQIN